MMRHWPKLAPRWQQFLQVAAPSCGIIALAEVANGSPIKNIFDASPYARGRLRLVVPDAFQRFHPQRGIDGLHRQTAEDRAGVLTQRLDPLLGVFCGCAILRGRGPRSCDSSGRLCTCKDRSGAGSAHVTENSWTLADGVGLDHVGDLLCAYRQYLRLMAHSRKVLPVDRFLEIQYEELVADREAMSRKMIEFCGLDWNDACLHSERNRRPVRTASVWQARQPVYRTSVARWRRYEPWLGALRELLPDAERNGVHSRQ